MAHGSTQTQNHTLTTHFALSVVSGFDSMLFGDNDMIIQWQDYWWQNFAIWSKQKNICCYLCVDFGEDLLATELPTCISKKADI